MLAAQRDLTLALRLSPRDGDVAEQLRRLARLLAPGRRADSVERSSSEPPGGPGEGLRTSHPDGPGADLRTSSPEPIEQEDEPDESQLEDLTAKLRANPSDHAIALTLARLLTALGKDLELLALLSARIEEGDERARADLEPMRRDVLGRLARTARDGGRASEAEIYELMRDAE